MVRPERTAIVEALGDVYDPCCADRGISIVDMGVVEDVRIDGGRVEVDLVLTSGWCPFVTTMSTAIPDRLRSVEGVEDVDVRVLQVPSGLKLEDYDPKKVQVELREVPPQPTPTPVASPTPVPSPTPPPG